MELKSILKIDLSRTNNEGMNILALLLKMVKLMPHDSQETLPAAEEEEERSEVLDERGAMGPWLEE